jgi:hypothetical protein
MHLELYEYDQLDEFTYRFYSVGRNGTFEMRVQFVEIGYGSYNLGFGVHDLQADRLDDLVEIRNGDSQKILATVANVTLRFLEENSEAHIYASGSTESRTRLYQMGINKILPTLNGYIIAGYLVKRNKIEAPEGNFLKLNGQWHAVELGVTYEAFLIYKA